MARRAEALLKHLALSPLVPAPDRCNVLPQSLTPYLPDVDAILLPTLSKIDLTHRHYNSFASFRLQSNVGFRCAATTKIASSPKAHLYLIGHSARGRLLTVTDSSIALRTTFGTLDTSRSPARALADREAPSNFFCIKSGGRIDPVGQQVIAHLRNAATRNVRCHHGPLQCTPLNTNH